eukprot:CAMPEP_0168561148 /NCGR_PEP_ID=MMETSP0413-20121227/11438_1 /TAXON_ID=136452 /ORGANISM="Filamoeba nolandi, Strain NC-AS-23-1" /LENGTH=721 /DNA_ID=CAMNT_0008592495 /DNA_START=61 /DNA_END=2226 /DNA_ORIENTATION=-
MERGSQNTPSKELSSQSEEDEGSPDSSEDRSSSTANSPIPVTPSTTEPTSSIHKKQKLDTNKQNVSSILPPFYNLQSSNTNIPPTATAQNNQPSQTNFQNIPQDSLQTININLTSRQEIPSTEELSSMSSPLAPKNSQRQNVSEDFPRGQASSQVGLLERQGLHPQIPQFGIGFQPYSPLAVNVTPLSLTYPLPSFPPPQAQPYYSPTPQYHIPLQYSMQQPPSRSPTDSVHHPTQPTITNNQREYQTSQTDPRLTSNLQTLTVSSADQFSSFSTPSSGSIANLPPSQAAVPLSSNPNQVSPGNPSVSRESTAIQTPQGESPGALYLQSPHSSQSRPSSSTTTRSIPEEPYFSWQPLPPVQLGRPGVYGVAYPQTVSVYPQYVNQIYETSGLPVQGSLPPLGVWQVNPSQGIPTTAPPSTGYQQRSGSWVPPYSPHKRPAEAPRSLNVVPSSMHRFELQMQPFSNQRKSYKSEKRYILPNPITICLKKKRPQSDNNNNASTSESPDDVVSGYVSVDLVDGMGNQIANKDEIFASIDGTFSQTLSAEGVAQFSLKVLANSGPDKYRLLFKVFYTTRDGVSYEEDILSQAFSVKSNKALKAKMAQEAQKENQAQLLDLNPIDGRPHKSVSVWIKTKGIVNPIVYFGDRQAAIRDWEDELIKCTTPIRLDIAQTTTVDVTVSNVTAEGTVPVEGRLQYTYKVKKPRVDPPNPPMNNNNQPGPPG